MLTNLFNIHGVLKFFVDVSRLYLFKPVFQVRNNGPSPIEYSEVTILVPFKYNKQEEPNYLLYLMDLQVSPVLEILPLFSIQPGAIKRLVKRAVMFCYL